jgi:hypothetical protein
MDDLWVHLTAIFNSNCNPAMTKSGAIVFIFRFSRMRQNFLTYINLAAHVYKFG